MKKRKDKGEQILWAPWRLSYIKNVRRHKGCFICSALKGRNDRKNLLLYRGKATAVLLNKFPYNNCHLLIAPKRHVPDYEAMNDGELLELARTLGLCMRALEKTVRPEGFNIGLNIGRAAGAGLLGHLHYHVVPRWIGDTNFMPAVAGTKVISQSLKAAYEMLKKELEKNAC